MHPILGLMATGSGTLDPVLSAGPGGTIQRVDLAATYDTSVGIRFNTDGTIDTGLEKDGAGMVWTNAGNWITPAGDATADYDVRFTSFNGTGGGDWTSEAAADDIWIALVTATRTWIMNSIASGTIYFTCAFEVRDGGGAPPATASSDYTFKIINGGA